MKTVWNPEWEGYQVQGKEGIELLRSTGPTNRWYWQNWRVREPYKDVITKKCAEQRCRGEEPIIVQWPVYPGVYRWKDHYSIKWSPSAYLGE